MMLAIAGKATADDTPWIAVSTTSIQISGDDLKEYGDQTANDDAIQAHVAAIQRVTQTLRAISRESSSSPILIARS